MLKKYLLIWLTIIVSVIFVIRLASLQLSSDSYFNSDFAIQELSVYPERGLIFDRNGNLLVANQPSYELIIIPENTSEFDTISFANLIDMNQDELKRVINNSITSLFYYIIVLFISLQPRKLHYSTALPAELITGL